MPTPRTFTIEELRSLTLLDVEAMSAEDRARYAQAWREWGQLMDARYLDGDYDRVGSRRAYEWGE